MVMGENAVAGDDVILGTGVRSMTDVAGVMESSSAPHTCSRKCISARFMDHRRTLSRADTTPAIETRHSSYETR